MEKLEIPMKLNAEWTDDCQGKKDYDGDILSISTRYWPSNYQRNGKISAHSALILRFKDYPEYISIEDKTFEAATESEVKLQVEEWAQKQMDNVVYLVKNHKHGTFIKTATKIAWLVIGLCIGIITGILITITEKSL